MHIDNYLAYIRTAELGSLTKAAKELGYSHSGISHIINNLEKQWDVALLIRNNSGVTMTPEGLKLLPLLKDVYAANERLLNKLTEIRGQNSGQIRIASFTSVLVQWLPSIIKEFKKQYPNVSFEFFTLNDFLELEHWVLEGRAELGLLELPVDNELEITFLGDDQYVVILPKGHCLTTYDIIPIQKLNGEIFIMVEGGPESRIANTLKKYEVTPNIQYIVQDDHAIIPMVESGLGISILPRLLLSRTPYNIVIKELDVPFFRTLGIIQRKDRYASPAVKKFIKFVKFLRDNQKNGI